MEMFRTVSPGCLCRIRVSAGVAAAALRRVMAASRGGGGAMVLKIDRSLGVLAVDDDDADDGKKPTVF